MTPPTLGIALTTDMAHYAPGGTIIARLRASSAGKEGVTLHFRSAQRCDFVIQDTNGTTLWQWGADRMFGQALGEETLGPARPELVCREQFAAPLAAGTYRVVGSLTSSDLPMSAAVMITVAVPPSARP